MIRHDEANRAGVDLTDEQAMVAVQRHGDHAAFAQLVHRWEAPLWRLCTRMTGDSHPGEDLAQETFARVFAKRGQYNGGRRFSTWLWPIALNVCFAQQRQRQACKADGRSARRSPPGISRD
jgi:RNA polymerase sigma factor (sigma-70 family)